MTSSRANRVAYAAIVGATLLTAALGSAASIDAARFYSQLHQPHWAPPAWVFGPVWSVLYLAMALAACLVVARAGQRRASAALCLYGVQLALNAAWSWLFFHLRLGAWAMADVVMLLALIIATAVVFKSLRVAAFWLLVPYAAWVAFASALTLAMWRLNPAVL